MGGAHPTNVFARVRALDECVALVTESAESACSYDSSTQVQKNLLILVVNVLAVNFWLFIVHSPLYISSLESVLHILLPALRAFSRSTSAVSAWEDAGLSRPETSAPHWSPRRTSHGERSLLQLLLSSCR